MSITLNQDTTQILIEEEYKSLARVHKPQGRMQKGKLLAEATRNIEELLKDENKFKEWLQSKK
jgi:hypothetical protein